LSAWFSPQKAAGSFAALKRLMPTDRALIDAWILDGKGARALSARMPMSVGKVMPHGSTTNGPSDRLSVIPSSRRS